MASQTGVAPAGKFGVRACVGTDTESLDVLAEAQTAWLRSRDFGQPIDVLRYLANGQRLASQVFGLQVGLLREGSVADVVIMDYRPPTQLEAGTLAAHVLNGLSSRQVEAVMIDGMWRLWARKPLGIAAVESMKNAQEQARAVWARMSAS
jgi:cytosine/adenosine deaminase-related metal-dependent hydrolase